MRNFIRVAKTGDIPEGKGRAVNVGRKLVAVFKVAGRFYAVNDICPHMGGSLASGAVHGTQVICPSHGMCFDLGTGESADAFGHCIQTYEVKVEGDDLLIDAWWAESKSKPARADSRPLRPRSFPPAARAGGDPAARPFAEKNGTVPLLSVVDGRGSSSR